MIATGEICSGRVGLTLRSAYVKGTRSSSRLVPLENLDKVMTRKPDDEAAAVARWAEGVAKDAPPLNREQRALLQRVLQGQRPRTARCTQ